MTDPTRHATQGAVDRLRLKLQESWPDGGRLLVEDVLREQPVVALSDDSLLKLIYAEFCLRHEHDERPQHEEYVERFPDHVDRLRHLFEMHSTIGESEMETGDEAADTGTDKSIRQDGWKGASPSRGSATWISDSTVGDLTKGRYRLARELGEGTFGRVYLGFDEQLRRHVAIKVPTAERFQKPEDAEQYLVEARTVASLDHPHIVPVHDVGRTADGSIYVVSKFIEGCTLADRIRENRPDHAESAQLLAAVAQALQHAHDRRLIHRDIKPANILLEESTGTPYVADFGLAIREEDYLQEHRLAGTPSYMSPEQARREGHRLDGRSDVFALGTILYEMLTGNQAFCGSSVKETLNQVMSVDPPRPRTLDETIPAEPERICLKAIAKRASDRYATAAEMADDLLHWKEGLKLMQSEPPETTESRLLVFMFTDLVDSSAAKIELGDADYANKVARPHNAIFRAILSQFPESDESNYTGDGFLATFNRVSDAVNAALLFHLTLRTHAWDLPKPPQVSIGIHVGETITIDGADESQFHIASHAADMTARIMGLATGGQTLLSRHAFDDARQYVRAHPSIGRGEAPPLEWLAHGKYSFKGKDEAMEVFEVGAAGCAPLRAPEDTEKAKRAVSFEGQQTLGWRPAAGRRIPGRDGWVVQKKLGEGGFGEVWQAQQSRTREVRVFKFCFDPGRLLSFKRELTMFRLMREALGRCGDIAQLLDVRLDQPPYFLESQYVEQGNLTQWVERQGGIKQVPLDTRLELFACVCRTVSLAHSAGIIHKDIKPSNILIRNDDDGRPRPLLADFGIGEIADRTMLDKHGVTATGFTETVLGNESGTLGTRLYSPPESLVGQSANAAGDIYALGVLLYQLVVGDFHRPMAIGWEEYVADELLREDIRVCVEGDPSLRLDDAAKLSERIEALDDRRRVLNNRAEDFTIMRALLSLQARTVHVFPDLVEAVECGRTVTDGSKVTQSTLCEIADVLQMLGEKKLFSYTLGSDRGGPLPIDHLSLKPVDTLFFHQIDAGRLLPLINTIKPK